MLTKNPPSDLSVISEIWEVIGERMRNPTRESYVSRLVSDEKGIDRVLEKVGEEATEFIIAVKNDVSGRTTEEAADLLFHMLVALRASGGSLDDLVSELERRRH